MRMLIAVTLLLALCPAWTASDAAVPALNIVEGSTQMPEPERLGREALGRAAQGLRADGLPAMWMIEGQGRENLTGELQGRNPDEPTWRPHREWVAIDRADETVGWRRWTPRNDDSLRDRAFIYGPSRTLVVDHANSFQRATAGDVPAIRRRALMRRVPHLLIADVASRSASSVRWLRSVVVEGAEADEIRVELPSDGPLTLTIGRTGAVLGAAYDLYLPGRGMVAVEWHWTGWTPHVSLGLVPSAHRIDIGGVTFQDVRYSRYEAGAAIGDARTFLNPDLPSQSMSHAETPAWAAGAGPAEGEVSPGVHVARLGGFTVLFADIGASIVAFEAPEPFFGTESIPASNRRAAGTLTPQVIAHIRKSIPGKPISHVVISHHHGDHSGGAAAFTAEGARIVTEETQIGEGPRAVHVLSVGTNPHTDDNVVMWIPSAGVMIQGDLFYFDAGVGFQRGRDRMNRFFAGWLRLRGISPRLLYGVHNVGAAGPAALERLR